MIESPYTNQGTVFTKDTKEIQPVQNFLERVTVPVISEYAVDMEQDETTAMLESFFTNGIVILELETQENPEIIRENLLALSHYFGRLIGHKHAKGGIVDITTTPGIYDSDGVRRPQSDNGRQSPHTDGAFGDVPPIIALGCYRAAVGGGESVYVDMQDAFSYIEKKDIQATASLFLPNAATVIRGDQSKNGPVFSYVNNTIQASYSNHEYNETEISENSQRGFNLLEKYVNSPLNQLFVPTKPGSITVFDNLRMLHGRTGFTDVVGRERWLMRAWYDGNSKHVNAYQKGFQMPQ